MMDIDLDFSLAPGGTIYAARAIQLTSTQGQGILGTTGVLCVGVTPQQSELPPGMILNNTPPYVIADIAANLAFVPGTFVNFPVYGPGRNCIIDIDPAFGGTINPGNLIMSSVNGYGTQWTPQSGTQYIIGIARSVATAGQSCFVKVVIFPSPGSSANINEVSTALNTIGNATITAAGVVGGVTNRGGAQAGVAFTDTTPTAALTIAALTGSPVAGQSWEWTYYNGTNAQATLSAGSNTTLTGNTVIPANSWVRYLVTYVSASSVTYTEVAAGPTTPATTIPLIAFPRNLLDGGDFFVNPWQRGTSITGINTTVTYGPDRWFAAASSGGGSQSITLSQTAADNAIVGFSQHLKVQRANTTTDVHVINFGQVLETADCVRLQGQQVTLSFYAKTGANYSGGALTVALNHSTTAGNDTAAHLVAASTNWQAVPTVINTTQTLTSSYVRYQFTGTVPATATQLGLLFSWTPTGTAGSDDSISIDGIQLEQNSVATVFEHRDIEMELALCQRFYFQWNETNGANVATGAPTGTNTQGYSVWLPTPMRVAPTTVGVTIGGLKVIIDGAAATAVVGLTAGTAHSPTIISLTSTNTLTAAAHSILLQGSATTGSITASADL